MRWAFAVGLAATMAAGSGHAATIEVGTSEGAMPFVVVAGRIQYGDEIAFRRKTESLAQAVVLFHSPGGNAHAGMEIGRAIRRKKFITFVDHDATCTSACAVAWLGGARRYMGDGAYIGFHAAFDADTRQESGNGTARVALYARDMGLSDAAIDWITIKGPDDINVLTKARADALGIEVEIYRGTAPAADAPAGPQPVEPAAAAPASGDTAALALGLSADGSIATGGAVNFLNRDVAQDTALTVCRSSRWANDAARAACRVVVAFHGRCAAVAWTAAPGRRLTSWSLGFTQQGADDAALTRCRSAAGERAPFCRIGYHDCDNVALADRQSTYQPSVSAKPPENPDPVYVPVDDDPAPVPAAPPVYRQPPVYVPPAYYAPVVPAPRYALPVMRPHGGYRYRR